MTIPSHIATWDTYMYKQGKIDKAIAEYRKALELYPGYKGAIAGLAEAEKAAAGTKPSIAEDTVERKGIKLGDWKSALNEDPVDWLLEAENPSVRYFTLTELLDKPENDSEVAAAKAGIMSSAPVAKILSKQEPGGYWGKPEDFYMRGAKYKGTVWNLLILAQLGADGKDERIGRACDFILNSSYDRGSGGFSYKAFQGDERAEKKTRSSRA